MNLEEWKRSLLDRQEELSKDEEEVKRLDELRKGPCKWHETRERYEQQFRDSAKTYNERVRELNKEVDEYNSEWKKEKSGE